jgi:sugar phosphate isomerase/epimerase
MHFQKSIFFSLIFTLIFSFHSQAQADKQPDSKFGGVQIGLITYSWRSLPSTAADVIKYCQEAGINSLELMGDVAENYAGIPELPAGPKKGKQSDEVMSKYKKELEAAREKQRVWRISTSMKKYKELRKLFDVAGIDIHIVKFSPANWSDEEIDYAFKAAKVLGAVGITNEIGEAACKRLGKFAEKHDMYAIFHNHAQPGDPNFSFDKFLSYSPNNMLNLDVGHYYGSTGRHPVEIIERLHDRIISLHLKDKTSKYNGDPNKNRYWGTGGTQLAEILQFIQKNNWPIRCDIEVEYDIPKNSDALQETKNCIEYCKKALL